MKRTADAAAVAEVMAAYGSGTRARDVEALKAIFHPNAVMSGYLGPELLIGSPQPFFDHLAANEVAESYRAETTAVDVAGATARARVVEDDLFGMSFVNEFHLVRSDGRWLIVSKLFHHDAPEG